MFKYIKDVYYKSDFDFQSGIGDVDPSEFHSIFFHVLRTFRITSMNEPTPAYTVFVPIFLMLCFMIGLTMSIFSLYHGFDVKDLAFTTEAGVYSILYTFGLIMISCTKIDLPQYRRLLQAMKEDFRYVCTSGVKYRRRFFENQLLTWKTTIWFLIFIWSVAFGTVSVATLAWLYYLLTHTPGDDGKRPLLFPLWSPIFDFRDSPYYEITYVIFIIMPYGYAYTEMLNIVVEIVWIREIMAKADLIRWSIDDLFEGLSQRKHPTHNTWIFRRRLKDIVVQHQSMYRLLKDYVAVYKKLVMFTQEWFAPVACFTAYAAAEKWDDGECDIIMILLCFAAVVLTLIPNAMCTILADKVVSVADACWNIQFWKTSDSQLRLYVVMIIRMSIFPLPLRVPGFLNISLETFCHKLMTAYSFFNMLRQLK